VTVFAVTFVPAAGELMETFIASAHEGRGIIAALGEPCGEAAPPAVEGAEFGLELLEHAAARSRNAPSDVTRRDDDLIMWSLPVAATRAGQQPARPILQGAAPVPKTAALSITSSPRGDRRTSGAP
jgi:hypothetical protein